MNIINFWAKTSNHDDCKNGFHPLVCHLTDVAAVTKKMWDEVLPEAAKKRINENFGVENAGNLVAFIAGLHDLGKCSPPFTLRGHNEEGKQTARLLDLYRNEEIWTDSAEKSTNAPHGYITAIELPELLEGFGIKGKAADQIAVLIGGHHGVFPNSDWRKGGNKAIEKNLGKESWRKARLELTETLAQLLDVKSLEPNKSIKLDNASIMILAGLVSVADWIGSDTQFFKCEIEDFEKSINVNLTEYLVKAEKQAGHALEQLGWLDWAQTDESKQFLELFPKLKKHGLRQLQKDVVKIAEELKSPGIVVIESPTGEGKTEAAMFLADTWNINLKQTGIYFALPTMATSNQMFTRVVEFLEDRFEGGKVQTQLLHGKAVFSNDADKLKKRFRQELEKKLDYGHQSTEAEIKTLENGEKQEIHGIHDENCGDCIPSVVAAEWFTARKRGLLAPFGVGTIDQALMAVLQTKHVFVRLFGLAHKTVIIDEVHAYDAYMSTLLERLLEWLAALGSPVILLSATLPIERRNKLIEAYQKGLGVSTDEIQKAVYPRISYATDSTINVRKIDVSTKSRTLHVEKADEDFIEKLKAKLETDEGCVAIVCNTVQRAQDIYEELSKDDFFKDIIDLLHARFRFIDREEREQRVLERFGKPDESGKNPERPKRAVLIATQIIEQSLDLDFDLMISDLAPVDLLLQRAGRLHRHDRPRSDEFKTPMLWLIEPKITDGGEPNFENSIVYDKHILLRTWLALQEIEKVAIPNEVEKLIEAVYDLEKPFENLDENLKVLWQTSLENCLKAEEDDDEQASYRLIKRPSYSRHISGIFANNLEEDSPEIHKTLQAVTRLTQPTATVICLWEKGGKIFLDEDFSEEINLSKKPNIKLTKEMLRRSVGISKKSVVFKLLAEDVEKSWQNSALLRHHRILKFDENRKCEKFGNIFCLDENLGLQIF